MAFEPSKHLRNIKGKGGNAEYLDVKWRLVWLREEHPDATTAVEHIDITPDIAIFKATVTIPGGGSASDYGSETPRDFGDYIEKASTKAMGRALAALGYGTQFVGEELNEGDRIVDSPVDQPQHRATRNANGYQVADLGPAPASNGTPAPAANGRAAQRPPFDAKTFEKLLDVCWTDVENGKPLDAIREYLNAARVRMSEAQRIVARQQLTAIETATQERDAVTAPAAAPVAPPSSHAG